MPPADTLEARRALIETGLEGAVGAGEPAALYEAARYVLSGGGKRLRPMLTLLAAEHFGLAAEEALGPAVAVEVFHNFTLVHDDIMDRSATRRGRETVHVRWDEPTAILVGDLLMGVAYEQLALGPAARLGELLAVFAPTVRRLCEGQIEDMAFERRGDVTIAEYLGMIDRKTGALLACALELGAAAAGADAKDGARLRRVGLDLGRAFQIQDDLLDLVATSPDWGKPVGGDVLEGKRTWLLLSALERASGADRELFERVLRREVREDGIGEVRHRMDRLGVLSDTRDAVIFHTDAALAGLSALDASEPRAILEGLVRRMQSRTN